MEEEISHRFKKSFTYNGINYQINVIPFYSANETEKREYHLSEGEFLVHLYDADRHLYFSVYYNDKLEWDSNVSKLVMDDKNLIERIGFLIDDYYA